jgi:hypothetical protein
MCDVIVLIVVDVVLYNPELMLLKTGTTPTDLADQERDFTDPRKYLLTFRSIRCTSVSIR